MAKAHGKPLCENVKTGKFRKFLELVFKKTDGSGEMADRTRFF